MVSGIFFLINSRFFKWELLTTGYLLYAYLALLIAYKNNFPELIGRAKEMYTGC